MKMLPRVARPGIFVLGGLALLIGCSDDGPSYSLDLNDPDICVDNQTDSEPLLYVTSSDELYAIPEGRSIREAADGEYIVTSVDGEEEYRYPTCSEPVSTTPDSEPEESEDTLVDESTTTQAVDTTGDVPTTQATRTSTTVRSNATSTAAPRSTSTMAPYGGTTTTSYVPQGPPSGTWIRNDSRCRWLGASSCGVYSGGNGQWEEAGPSGGPGSTFTPIAGTSGQLAYNLLSGNSIENCDWNGSGQCGYYFTGRPGELTLGPVG